MKICILTCSVVSDAIYSISINEIHNMRFRIMVLDNFNRKNNLPPEYYPVVMFGINTSKLYKYITKGKRILVYGEFNKRNYKREDGSQYTDIGIIARQIEFMSSNNTNATGDTNNSYFIDGNESNKNKDEMEDDMGDSDLEEDPEELLF